VVGPRTSEFSPPAPEIYTPPAPETTASPVADFDLPRSPKSFYKLAAENGWAVDATYSRGPWLYVSGEDYSWRHNITLRFARGAQRVGAIWLAKTTEGEYAAGSIVIPDAGWAFEAAHVANFLEPISNDKLKTYLKEVPRAP
jgi:hypothetical protein